MATVQQAVHRRSCIATQRSDRGYSSKVQQMVRQVERETRGREWKAAEEEQRKKREKYEQSNWRQCSQRELERMGPVARSRYLAYEPPSKELQERQQESVRRVRERQTRKKIAQQDRLTLSQLVELEKDSELVGQIKAAEARQRVRDLRQCYEKQQEEELQWLVNSQPTSLEAVRLKTFLKPHPPDHAHFTHLPSLGDPLSYTQRKRCEFLVEDEKDLT